MILGGEEMEVRRKMELFDKRFVHFMWNDSLEGREGFFANDIDTLKAAVNYNSSDNRGVVKKGDERHPFKFVGGLCYVFFYYDPNYECKAAYAQGKVVQFRYHGESDNDWAYCTGIPKWLDTCEYRVKPEEIYEEKKRRMTNRELAKWLAQGNGECLQNTIAFVVWSYLTENKDKTVSNGVKIRGWDETEWHEPEIEEE